MSSPDRWHTAKETAALLGVGRTRLRKSGLRHVKVGRRCFYLRSDIEANRAAFERNGRAAFCVETFTIYPRWTDEHNNSRALSDHQLYETWRAMMDRCYVGHVWRSWDAYGGRGIRVYKPWHDVVVFSHDIEELLGPRPLGRSLHRLDGEGHYEPGNVIWANDSEQNASRGSVLARPLCFCTFDCSFLPGVCAFNGLPWLVLADFVREQVRRIEALRDAPLHSLVLHEHTGAHDDCFACVRQDPFGVSALLGTELSAREHCEAAAGFTHRHLAPLGLLGL